MIIHHTRCMPKSKIAITLEKSYVEKVDRLVDENLYPNRSRLIEAAVGEKLKRLEKTRLGLESAKLDVNEERSMADEGLNRDVETWPEY